MLSTSVPCSFERVISWAAATQSTYYKTYCTNSRPQNLISARIPCLYRTGVDHSASSRAAVFYHSVGDVAPERAPTVNLPSIANEDKGK